MKLPYIDHSKFEAPEGYFEDFTNDIMAKIGATETPKKSKNIIKMLFYSVSVAAVLVLGIFIFNQNGNVEQTFEEDWAYQNISSDYFMYEYPSLEYDDSLSIEEFQAYEGYTFSDSFFIDCCY